MDETETEELSEIDKHIIYSLFSGGQNFKNTLETFAELLEKWWQWLAGLYYGFPAIFCCQCLVFQCLGYSIPNS